MFPLKVALLQLPFASFSSCWRLPGFLSLPSVPEDLLQAVARTVEVTVASDSGRFSNEAAVSLLPGAQRAEAERGRCGVGLEVWRGWNRSGGRKGRYLEEPKEGPVWFWGRLGGFMMFENEI